MPTKRRKQPGLMNGNRRSGSQPIGDYPNPARTLRHLRFTPAVVLTITGVAAALMSGCATGPNTAPSATQQVQTVAAESQYANVIRAIGGKYVSVYTIIQNPNVDPHEFQVGPADAKRTGNAALVVQNGLGYDAFMQQLESAATNPHRSVITAGTVVGGHSGQTNPHVWYQPGAMKKIATAIETSLAQHDPAHKSVFAGNLTQFNQSLTPWAEEINKISKQYPGAPVAVTEPVADDLLKAAGLTIKTPWSFEAAVMNGIDPSPQAVAEEKALLVHHQVKVFIYNPQAGDNITSSLYHIAKANHIPIVGAYETLPQGYSYATWMNAETTAIYRALKQGKSTERMSS